MKKTARASAGKRPTPARAKPTIRNSAVQRPAPPRKSHAALRDDEVRRRIAEAAYLRAEKRGFAPGQELEDWFQAEIEIMRRLRAEPPA